jgi:drug/metabolite transporter (DMT)-like permease
MSRSLRADLALLLMCVFWGGTFVLVKQALGDVSTLLYLTLRFGAGTLALLAFGGRPGKPGAIVGLFLFLGYVLQTHGLRFTTPSRSAFITSLAVVLVPLGHGLIKRVWPGWGVGIGAALALVGLLLLTNPLGSASIHIGDLWTLGCAIAFTIHILLVGHFSPRVRPLDLATGQTLAATALGLLTFPWAEGWFLRPSGTVWVAVAITGLLCTALAFFVQAWAQQSTTSSHVALIFATEPVFAWITSAILLGERLGLTASIGALLILGGIVFAELLVY